MRVRKVERRGAFLFEFLCRRCLDLNADVSFLWICFSGQETLSAPPAASEGTTAAGSEDNKK